MALHTNENASIDTEAKDALVKQFRIENIAVAEAMLANVASDESPLFGLDDLDHQIRDKDSVEIPETYTLAVDSIGMQLEGMQERRVVKLAGAHKEQK